MKTLGMIGGLGPESTVDYYVSIVELYRKRKADGTYPQFLINSIDLDKGRALITANDLLALVDKMVNEQAVEAIVLGGTELPLILRDEAHNGIPLLNTTRIHVEAAVTEMLF